MCQSDQLTTKVANLGNKIAAGCGRSAYGLDSDGLEAVDDLMSHLLLLVGEQRASRAGDWLEKGVRAGLEHAANDARVDVAAHQVVDDGQAGVHGSQAPVDELGRWQDATSAVQVVLDVLLGGVLVENVLEFVEDVHAVVAGVLELALVGRQRRVAETLRRVLDRRLGPVDHAVVESVATQRRVDGVTPVARMHAAAEALVLDKAVDFGFVCGSVVAS